MALTATYTASLRTLSYTAEGVIDSSEATQEYYTAGANRVGLLHFPGMNMTNKVITGIQITATASRAGYGLGRDKVVYLRASNYQATSQSGVKGSAFVGASLGTFVGQFYGNTSSYTLSGGLLTNLANYFAAGNNTVLLYNPDPEQYPFLLCAGTRIPNALHSRLHDVPWERSLLPDPVVEMSMEDAERLGIELGDPVEITTSVGSLTFQALPTATVQPGEVYIYHGYRELDINSILDGAALDPYSGFPAYRSACCNVRRK